MGKFGKAVEKLANDAERAARALKERGAKPGLGDVQTVQFNTVIVQRLSPARDMGVGVRTGAIA